MDIVWTWQGVSVRKESRDEWVEWFLSSPCRKMVIFEGIVPSVADCSNVIIQGCKFRIDLCCKAKTRTSRSSRTS